MVMGIYRARRGQGTESIVLVVPYSFSNVPCECIETRIKHAIDDGFCCISINSIENDIDNNWIDFRVNENGIVIRVD